MGNLNLNTTIEVEAKRIDDFDKFCDLWGYYYGREIVPLPSNQNYLFKLSKDYAESLEFNLNYVKIVPNN